MFRILPIFGTSTENNPQQNTHTKKKKRHSRGGCRRGMKHKLNWAKGNERKKENQSLMFSTEPLNELGPTVDDKASEDNLREVLQSENKLKESTEIQKEREYALNELSEICDDWIRHSAVRK
ncbi:hypothetical protein RFI_31180, partial [Reticulomyxa filosa]